MKDSFTSKESSHSSILALCVPIGVALVSMIIAGILSVDSTNTTLSVVINILTELSFLLIVVLICKTRDISFLKATKMDVKPHKTYVCLALLLGFVCLLLFTPIISLWETLLSSIGYSIKSDLPYSLNNVWMVIFAIISVGILPALCEETLFRGTVQNGTTNLGIKKAILYSALLFSLMHQNLQQLPYTFVLGIVSGILLFYSRSIWPSIIFHFSNNTFVILLMAFPDINNIIFSWWLATENFAHPLLWQIIFSIVCVVVACLIIYFMIKFFSKRSSHTYQIEDSTTMFSNKTLLVPVILGLVLLLISTLNKFGVL